MSNYLKATSGEWVCGERRFADWNMPTTIPITAGEEVICEVNAVMPAAVSTDDDRVKINEGVANAHVLAASKDLYEALRYMSDPMIRLYKHQDQPENKCACYDCSYHRAKAAMEKAEGNK